MTSQRTGRTLGLRRIRVGIRDARIAEPDSFAAAKIAEVGVTTLATD